jgi:hypothetical protein
MSKPMAAEDQRTVPGGHDPRDLTRANRALDAANFFLADVRDGLGPYLAIYLLTMQKWDEASIGIVMSIATAAGILAQTPAGAFIDATRAKRIAVAVAALLVTAASLVRFFGRGDLAGHRPCRCRHLRPGSRCDHPGYRRAQGLHPAHRPQRVVQPGRQCVRGGPCRRRSLWLRPIRRVLFAGGELGRELGERAGNPRASHR